LSSPGIRALPTRPMQADGRFRGPPLIGKALGGQHHGMM
jgi:hypothetical protein